LDDRPHTRSSGTRRSVSPDAGIPRTASAAPGRSRTPANTDPGSSVDTSGPWCAPVTMGMAEPSWCDTSIEPFGTLR
jgi:hypothetical protein